MGIGEGRGCRVRKTRASNLFEYHCVTTVQKTYKTFYLKNIRSMVGVEHITLLCTYVFNSS